MARKGKKRNGSSRNGNEVLADAKERAKIEQHWRLAC